MHVVTLKLNYSYTWYDVYVSYLYHNSCGRYGGNARKGIAVTLPWEYVYMVDVTRCYRYTYSKKKMCIISVPDKFTYDSDR